jgi:hypothetical protein
MITKKTHFEIEGIESPIRPKMVGETFTYRLPWGATVSVTYKDYWVNRMTSTVYHVFLYEELDYKISFPKTYYMGDLYNNFLCGWRQLCLQSREAHRLNPADPVK